MDINIEELSQLNEVKITAIGVGGGGSNAINHLSIHGVYNTINLVAINTDKQHLDKTESHVKLLIGEKITRGFGAGMDPSIGQKSAEESYEQIKDIIKDSNIVFIATGLGGGTGTGASPVVAKAAKDIGALTIAVVTKPFKFEGERKEEVAEKGIRELKEFVDAIIVVPNEKLLATVDKKLGMRDAFKLVDNILAQALNGVSSIILNSSGGGINADYADLERVMQHKGLALIGVGNKTGEDSAIEAVKEALESPLLDNIDIKGCKGAILYYEINENYPIYAIPNANELIQHKLDPNGIFKFAYSFNNEIQDDQIKATLVVTGFEKEVVVKEPNENNNSVNIKNATPQSIRLRRVSGSNESLFEGDLETPSFLRNQRD
ncbi:cell division protein FtsZ [Helicobacter sp. MIT 99-5507]|uniref:cell division protein FtsZ n=1 Tax=Helicobacter sp. MIT 99-5507 TaxID=152489 RepID=UPI0015F1678C|nr:cell division protein FtsZ [Helicobacter sp. MIT 99-5507]